MLNDLIAYLNKEENEMESLVELVSVFDTERNTKLNFLETFLEDFRVFKCDCDRLITQDKDILLYDKLLRFLVTNWNEE